MYRKVKGAIAAVCVLSTINLQAASDQKSRFEKLEVFNKVLYLIESQYYREVDSEKLIEGAINGMMNTLDPHSNFLDKNVFSRMQEETSGEFGGLGIEVTQKDGSVIIVTPIEDSPAYKAGIKPGDKIVEINHESIIGMELEDAIEKFKGKNKEKIHLGITRDGFDGIKNFEIIREIIQIKPVKSELVEKQFAYLRLVQFQKKSGFYIAEALKKLEGDAKKSGGLKGIILDLRSNPGGLLDEAVEVSSIFLKDGIVVSTEGRDPKQKEVRYVKKNGFKELEMPLIVLINGSTASASEIVAGALQDHKRALILGTQSFGKGSVQSVVKIDDERGVKMTIAQYMTPSNKKIQAIGIKPDIEIEETEGNWISENRKETSIIREKDLKNHLTATVETAEEKAHREEMDKKDREVREEKLKLIREFKATKSKETKDRMVQKDDLAEEKRFSPATDYQVLQAVNYLNSIGIIKNLGLEKSVQK